MHVQLISEESMRRNLLDRGMRFLTGINDVA